MIPRNPDFHGADLGELDAEAFQEGRGRQRQQQAGRGQDDVDQRQRPGGVARPEHPDPRVPVGGRGNDRDIGGWNGHRLHIMVYSGRWAQLGGHDGPAPRGRPRPRLSWARAPQDPDDQGIQVLRLVNHPPSGARNHRRGRPQRVWQVQRRRRPDLGHGGAGRQEPARRLHGRRHLRRRRLPPGPRACRGLLDHRQHRRRPADRLHRGHHLTHPVPRGRLGVPDQRHPMPPPRRPGAPQ